MKAGQALIRGQAQRGDGEKRGRQITTTRQNVDDDRGGVGALIEGFGAGGLNGSPAIIGHTAQDLDHLTIPAIAALQLAADRGHRGWKYPFLERGAGFASQNRDIVPRIIDRLTPTKGTGKVCDDHAILSDEVPICIGMHINGPPDGGRDDGILVVVEPNGAGL